MLIKQVENNLLLRNDISSNFLKAQLSNLKSVDFADLYLQLTTTESFALDEGIIKSGSFAINQGVGVRAICHDKTFLNHSSNISKKSIASLVNEIFIEPSNKNTNFKSNLDIKPTTSLYTFDNPISAIGKDKKISLLQNINKIGRSYDYVTNVIANLSMEYDEIAIFNTRDLMTSDIRPLVHLSISIVINKNGNIEKANSGLGGRYLLDMFTDEIIAEHVKKAYDQALLKTEAKTCPNGEMPVILGNGWAGVILHEAIGHGLESDFNRKESSAFSNKIGQQVASELVTIVDDGTIPNRRGSLNIDDEGNPSQKTVLIENGILCGYMFDELNAMLMGKQSTGNGRRESFASTTIPRMTNTYMLNGNSHPNEIIESVKNGIYAENFEGGQVDITSGQFVFNASIAWVIKNGKLDHPVKGCALVGNGPECLKHVTMVGNNMALDSGVGVCGKSGQSVPVGVGQPTIKVEKSLVVGGA